MHISPFSIKAAAMLLLFSSVLAAPQRGVASGDITPQQLIRIGSKTATCDGAQYPNECATAAQAAPFINAAFREYNISSIPEKAALIALMMSESGELQFNVGHDKVGQGTRNMQQFNFNLRYALSFPDLAPKVNAIRGNAITLSPESQNAILELVLPNKFSFGSAMWFYTTQCLDDVIKESVQRDGEAGFAGYLVNCVGTTVTTQVQEFYANAMAALSIASRY